MEESSEQIKKQARLHWYIGAALFVFALLTIGISQIEFATWAHIVIGLLISVAMGGLVTYFFMHLSNERRFIYQVLGLTVVCFLVLMLATLLAYSDEVGRIGGH